MTVTLAMTMVTTMLSVAMDQNDEGVCGDDAGDDIDDGGGDGDADHDGDYVHGGIGGDAGDTWDECDGGGDDNEGDSDNDGACCTDDDVDTWKLISTFDELFSFVISRVATHEDY